MVLFGFFELFVLIPMLFWISLSLQARRLRDIGWEPVFVIPAWVVAMAIDLTMAQSGPKLWMLPFAGPTILGWLIILLTEVCLLFWPGRTYAADDFLTLESPAERAPKPTTAAPAATRPARRPSPASPAGAGFGRRGL